jgi:hypothetical protein
MGWTQHLLYFQVLDCTKWIKKKVKTYLSDQGLVNCSNAANHLFAELTVTSLVLEMCQRL